MRVCVWWVERAPCVFTGVCVCTCGWWLGGAWGCVGWVVIKQKAAPNCVGWLVAFLLIRGSYEPKNQSVYFLKSRTERKGVKNRNRSPEQEGSRGSKIKEGSQGPSCNCNCSELFIAIVSRIKVLGIFTVPAHHFIGTVCFSTGTPSKNSGGSPCAFRTAAYLGSSIFRTSSSDLGPPPTVYPRGVPASGPLGGAFGGLPGVTAGARPRSASIPHSPLPRRWWRRHVARAESSPTITTDTTDLNHLVEASFSVQNHQQ